MRADADVTVLLNAAASGDASASERLLSLVYDNLRRVAQLQMAGERRNHTLTATALVHEAYFKLFGPRDVPWKDRGHFYKSAAESMRRILIDYARSNGAIKRGGNLKREELQDVIDMARSAPDEIERFNNAFLRLEKGWPEEAEVVRFRFYAGLSVEETACAMGASASTVERHWRFARAWLFRYTRLDL